MTKKMATPLCMHCDNPMYEEGQYINEDICEADHMNWQDENYNEETGAYDRLFNYV